MVTQELVKPQLELGEQVTRALAADSKIDLRAAAWWRNEETGQLRFLVSTPICDTHGPRKAYRQIRRAIEKNGLLDRFPLELLWAVGVDHAIVKRLRDTVGTGRSDLLLSSFDTDGFFSDCLYLYALK
jgi:hypothetical protein